MGGEAASAAPQGAEAPAHGGSSGERKWPQQFPRIHPRPGYRAGQPECVEKGPGRRREVLLDFRRLRQFVHTDACLRIQYTSSWSLCSESEARLLESLEPSMIELCSLAT